jgi:hypothetical protein
MAKVTSLNQVKPGDTVKIVSVSNNQCHQKAGDGPEFFVGKTAKVQVAESLEKIWVVPETMEHAIWFVSGDLEEITE